MLRLDRRSWHIETCRHNFSKHTPCLHIFLVSGPFYSPRNHQTDYHNHYLLDYSHLAHYYTPEDIGADAGCSSNTPACQNVVVLGSRCLLRTMARTMPMVFRAMLVGNDSKLNIKLTRGFVVFIFDEQVEIGSDQH